MIKFQKFHFSLSRSNWDLNSGFSSFVLFRYAPCLICCCSRIVNIFFIIFLNSFRPLRSLFVKRCFGDRLTIKVTSPPKMNKIYIHECIADGVSKINIQKSHLTENNCVIRYCCFAWRVNWKFWDLCRCNWLY